MRPLPFDDKPVRTSVRPSRAEFASIVDASEPVVLDGCLDEWPLYRALSAASTLAEKLAVLQAGIDDRPLEFSVLGAAHGGHLYFADGLDTRGQKLSVRGTFADFARRAADAERSGELAYLQALPIRTVPGWVKGLGVLPYLDGQRVQPSGIWIGSGGQVVDLHYDPFHNFICMLAGQKRVLVAPPEVMHDVYPRALDRSPFNAPASSAKLLEPDFERFPRLRSALEKVQVAVLSPGQVLYLPPFYWHHVESFGFNVMVNTWQHTMPAAQVRRVGALRRDALQLFARHTAEVRAAAAPRYAAAFALEGDPGGELPPAIADHLARLRRALSDAPLSVRRGEAAFYSHWILRTQGDPLELQPGEFERMVARMRAASVLAGMKRVLGNWLTPVPRLRAGGPLK